MSAKQQLKKEIREAYLFLREKNQTIPSETLEFMLNASLEKVDSLPDIEDFDKPKKVDTLKHLDLTDEQKRVAITLINLFGSGQHPWADEQTIDGFNVSYLKNLIKKNFNEFKDKTQTILKEIEAKM